MSSAPSTRGSRWADPVLRMAYRLGYRLVKTWWFLWRPQTDGAVVAVWLDGHILMVRHSYRTELGWPGGGIRRNEAPRDAARRELKEELGLAVDRDALSFATEMAISFDYRRDHVRIFELTLSAPPALNLDMREVIDAHFLEPQAVLELSVLPFIRLYLQKLPGTGGLQSRPAPAVLRERR